MFLINVTLIFKYKGKHINKYACYYILSKISLLICVILFECKNIFKRKAKHKKNVIIIIIINYHKR